MENPEQLNEIRQSMYAKANNEEFPNGFLTERRQVGTGKSITEKYASDVYYNMPLLKELCRQLSTKERL